MSIALTIRKYAPLLSGFDQEELPKRIQIHYYGQTVILEFNKNENNAIYIGKVILTQTGQQLAHFCGSRPVESFMDYILDKWKKKGIVVVLVHPRKQ